MTRPAFRAPARNLVDFAPADEESGIGFVAPGLQLGHDARTGGLRQGAEFLCLIVEAWSIQTDVQQQCTFTAARTIKQPSLPVPGNGNQASVSSSSIEGTRTLRAVPSRWRACRPSG
jgi:hypothetical protein